MVVTINSGANIYPMWKVENSAFKSTTETNWKPFGHQCKVTSFEINNNVKKAYGLGSYEAAAQVGLQFDGKVGFEFLLCDPWIFSPLTGNTSVDAGVGPYTHTFINTAATPAALAAMNSIQIDMSYALATASHHTLQGCILKTLGMKLAVNEPVVMTAEFEFANSVWSESSVTAQVAPTDAPFTFANANIEFPTGTTLSTTMPVQSADFTINRNGAGVKGLGSRTTQAMITKQSEYDLKASLPFNLKTLLEYCYGSSSSLSPDAVLTETANMRIILDNGLATTASRKMDINLTGILVNTFGTNGSVEDMLTQDIAFSIRGIKSIIATDNSASQPV